MDVVLPKKDGCFQDEWDIYYEFVPLRTRIDLTLFICLSFSFGLFGIWATMSMLNVTSSTLDGVIRTT